MITEADWKNWKPADFRPYVDIALDCFGPNRLMFGTDQMYWPEGIGLAIEGIESAPFLTAAEKRDIFYNNAVRFLKLEETGGSKTP